MDSRYRLLRVGSCSLAIGLGLFACIGCLETETDTRPKRTRATTQSSEDYLLRAMEYLERIDDFDEHSARNQAAYQLNRWLDSQKVDLNWKPDDMVNRLPKSVRERGVIDELSKQRFTNDDVYAIQEAVWMRQLSKWVLQRPLDPLFAKWLDGHKSELGAETAEQLGEAYRLFDWTIRNIQLDDLLPSPDESTAAPAAGVGDTAKAANAAAPAAIRGLPGPGYHQEPMQVLLYGHGDAWQRMRVFTLMARQQGIEVVTLAFPGRTIPPRPRPWVSGVLLGNQLYLFDMRLGIAIPKKDWEGIVTLKDALADPELLKSLEIDEKHPYRIASEDLAEVVALIDVVGSHLSQRTQLVEKQLVGDHRTVLSVPSTSLATKIKACPGISDVYLWSVPFEANWYRAFVEQKIRNDPQAAALYMAENSMFLNRTPLVRGRIAYLRGEIENEEERQGAKVLLMQSRVPQNHLDELGTNDEVQKQLGIARDQRLNPQQFATQMELFKAMLTRSKQFASFWLGMCQLESGRPDAAVEWFQTRMLDIWPDSPLAPLARYNLARTYEAQGKLGEAQRLLFADKSLQEHGNYLRARMLEKHIAEQDKK